MVTLPSAPTPLVAVTGRRARASTEQWPYPAPSALPRAYLDAVVRAGGQPVVVDPAGDLAPLLDRVDAVVLTGGPDVDPSLYGEERHAEVYGVDRAADESEAALVRAAIERQTPTLAICRGLQVLNVALGGTLHQHIPDLPGVERHGRPGETGGAWLHDIDVTPESLLASVFGTTRRRGLLPSPPVGRQARDRPARHRRCRTTASSKVSSSDGTWLLAVQWHPEDTADRDRAQQRLFDALVERVRD